MTSDNMLCIGKKCALNRIEEMKGSGGEIYKQSLYVKTLLNYPWPSGEKTLGEVN